MVRVDEVRLECLLERLRDLDQRPAPEHERPIREVARAFLLEAIRDLSHRLHDGDYSRGASGAGGDGGGAGAANH